jgi:hypothetical protein
MNANGLEEPTELATGDGLGLLEGQELCLVIC